MIPIYSPVPLPCENCEQYILLGYEFIITDNLYFCSEECAIDFYLHDKQEAYLTKDKLYRGDD